MKAYSAREKRSDAVVNMAMCGVYATVLALNDRYGWKLAAEQVAANVGEIISGYAEESNGYNMVDLMVAELRERGFDKFEISLKKGGRR